MFTTTSTTNDNSQSLRWMERSKTWLQEVFWSKGFQKLEGIFWYFRQSFSEQ